MTVSIRSICNNIYSMPRYFFPTEEAGKYMVQCLLSQNLNITPIIQVVRSEKWGVIFFSTCCLFHGAMGGWKEPGDDKLGAMPCDLSLSACHGQHSEVIPSSKKVSFQSDDETSAQMLFKIFRLEISLHTNHVHVLIVKSSHEKQGIAAKEIQHILRTHFSIKKLMAKILWGKYFVTKYNLKKKIIKDLQISSCRKDSIICLVY